MPTWFQIASRRSTVLRAARYAVLVGPILIAINHGRALLGDEITPERLVSMALTVMVPYCVSTASTIGATLQMARGGCETDGD